MFYFTKLKNWLADALFPPTCFNCKKIIGKKESGLCQKCFEQVPINQTLFCGICRARLPNNRKICHKNAPYVLAAATDYQNEIVRKLVWQLKYRGKKQVVLPLAQILAAYIGLIGPIYGEPRRTICPIPLHPKRERERGFNQSLLLAKELSVNFNFIVDTSLIRIKHAEPQAKAGDRKTRQENISGSFAVKPINNLAGKNIILLDDVCTSGSTLNEAARVLKSVGAKKIIALVIAKV